jgi:metallo-beta-lactamase family protein
MAGEEIAVKASIHTLGGFSAHASQSQLLDWVNGFSNKPKIYLVHGEPEAKRTLQAKLSQRGFLVEVAAEGRSISI